MLALTSNLKRKTVKPVVYALTLEVVSSDEKKHGFFTNLILDYSLEGAIKETTILAEKNLGFKIKSSFLLGYKSESLEEMISKATEIDMVETSTNVLMSKIIKTDNKELFEKNKKKFNANEIMLLEEALKN